MNKKLRDFGLAILLISLSIAVVFTNLAPTHLALAQSNGTMKTLTLGNAGLLFPYDAQRCPGQQSMVWGMFTTTDITGPADVYVEVYGKYKTEHIWNRLGEYLLRYPSGVVKNIPALPWYTIPPWTLPDPPEDDSTFQLLILGSVANHGGPKPTYEPVGPSPGYPIYIARSTQIQANTEYDVLAIKQIKIEGVQDPQNPVTHEAVRYTAVLTEPSIGLGAYSALTPKVTWEVSPTGSRKTMSPYGGGASIEPTYGEDNPWTDTPPVDTQGRKKVKATVTWSGKNGEVTPPVEREKDYDLLFRKDELDYNQPYPNWYAYWGDQDDQAITVEGFDAHNTAQYSYGGNGATAGWGADTYAKTDVKTGMTNVFKTAGNAETDYVFTRGKFVVVMHKYGIDSLAATILHERLHEQVYQNWLPGGIWYGLKDSDYDGIPDGEEKAIGLDPNNPDTFPDFPITATIGYNVHNVVSGVSVGGSNHDEEVWIEYNCQNAVGNKNNDWANPGMQSKPPVGPPAASALLRSPEALSGASSADATTDTNAIVETGTNATLSGTFSDHGEDSDGDGLFDFLTVKVGINVVTAGTYSLCGNLVDSHGRWLTGASNETVYFNAGTNFFDLNFDGLSLRRLRTDGPYTLSDVYLWGNGTEQALENAYKTTAYGFEQFEQPKAELTGSFSDSVVDANGNSMFDRLDVSAGINVTEAGNYTVVADLNLNNGGTLVSTNSSYLNTGEQDIILSFDGQAIRSHRANGPYNLKTLEVQDQNYNQIDIVGDAYNTSTYAYTQFERPEAEFTGEFNTFGVDTDSNGLFNILKVQAQVDAEQAGNYTFSADLSDLSDNDITANSTTVLLNTGIQNVTLDLDGVAIGDNGADGPYVLTSLEMLNSDGALLSAEPYYLNTSSYSNSQFDRAGKIVGKIQGQDGTPVENARVYINDVNDTLLSSTYTDYNGTYSFRGLDTGTYDLLVWVSGSNPNIQTANASVTKGQTTMVDFTFSIIPEFPSLLVLPLFMMMTIVAAGVYRKMKKRQRSRSPFIVDYQDRCHCNQ